MQLQWQTARNKRTFSLTYWLGEDLSRLIAGRRQHRLKHELIAGGSGLGLVLGAEWSRLLSCRARKLRGSSSCETGGKQWQK